MDCVSSAIQSSILSLPRLPHPTLSPYPSTSPFPASSPCITCPLIFLSFLLFSLKSNFISLPLILPSFSPYPDCLFIFGWKGPERLSRRFSSTFLSFHYIKNSSSSSLFLSSCHLVHKTPNHQNQYCQCAFLQTTDKLQLYITCCVFRFNFMLMMLCL